MNGKRRAPFAPLLLLGLAGGLALSLYACSNQGEGERCDVRGDNGGNDECDNGLICTRAADLNGAQSGGDRCCPQNRTQATTPVCAQPQNIIGADAAPPPLDSTAPDAPADTGPTPDASDASDAQDAAEDAADAD